MRQDEQRNFMENPKGEMLLGTSRPTCVCVCVCVYVCVCAYIYIYILADFKESG